MSPRRQRSRLRVPRRRPPRSTTPQLVLSVLALVGLMAFWHQLATGAAGCFATLAGPGPTSPSAGPADGAAGPAPQAPATRDAPVRPTVRLRLVPRPTPTPADAGATGSPIDAAPGRTP